MVHLPQKLVGVKRAGNVTLPSIAGNVGKGYVVVDYLSRHRIDTVRTDYVGNAVAGESQAVGGIDRLGSRGGEVTGTF
jgi:hypothetical protein